MFWGGESGKRMVGINGKAGADMGHVLGMLRTGEKRGWMNSRASIFHPVGSAPAWSHPRLFSHRTSHLVSQTTCRLCLKGPISRGSALLVLRITPTLFSMAYGIPSPWASSSPLSPAPSVLSHACLQPSTPIFVV